MDIETLAKELHEAGREAVEKGATVAAEKFGEKTRVFLSWEEISEAAREGRRIQARYLLGKYDIAKKAPPPVPTLTGNEISKRSGTFTDDELRYAAGARCRCGAGLAYVKNSNPFSGYWDCSDILTGRAKDKEVQHDAPLPFIFYEIKSEDQPSANGATTRPSGSANHIGG